jgi:hypothetical protein
LLGGLLARRLVVVAPKSWSTWYNLRMLVPWLRLLTLAQLLLQHFACVDILCVEVLCGYCCLCLRDCLLPLKLSLFVPALCVFMYSFCPVCWSRFGWVGRAVMHAEYPPCWMVEDDTPEASALQYICNHLGGRGCHRGRDSILDYNECKHLE